MRHKFVGSAVAAVMMVGGVTIAAPPASAAGLACHPTQYTASRTSTQTYVNNISCGLAQARIDRYFGGVASYYGRQAGAYDISNVSSTNGTNAGNWYRTKFTNALNFDWSSWSNTGWYSG